ncbi:glycosyltransferase [Bacillus sp. FJAT-45037]|uniref:glycosyltransferase n=1 Tax=Bacillus sp. FJAT-45037 TaxID=2011007 RepID=UPI000C23E495|nr:glycosyltransferase [Bacillus sp. FJAT-45037]
MNILFFTPYFKQSRGNATTAKRFIQGLRSVGVEVSVFAYEEESWSAEWDKLASEVDLYHILHLKRFASWQKEHQIDLSKPYVLTSGGTDINEDLADEDARALMRTVADDSCSITVFTADAKEKLSHSYPILNERTYVIPQSIWLPELTSSLNTHHLHGQPIILLPAGIRAVKDIFYLWESFSELANSYPNMKVVLVGASLDEDLYDQVVNKVETTDWFDYIGEVSLEEMSHIYYQADVVINTSISEGQPTALLEAMFCRKVVIARNNPGNLSVVKDQQNGFVIKSPEEFTRIMNTLMLNPKLMNRTEEAAQSYVAKHHRLEDEMKAYVAVYDHCINKAT